MVLDAGIIAPMKALTEPRNSPSIPFLQNISWTMSNLCRNKVSFCYLQNNKLFLQNPPTETKYVNELLPALIGMLEFEDKQIRADTCWAFSYITDGPNERIQMVLDVSSFCTNRLSFSLFLVWHCISCYHNDERE